MNEKILKITTKQGEIITSQELGELYNGFSKFADVMFALKYDSEVVVEIFNLFYMRDLIDYYSTDKIGKSNWTHHTANSFLRTCQLLGFPCDFEAENRHDGIIRGAENEVLLCAEWELDEKTIFDIKGEINKLIKTCKMNKNCEAFLFTYNLRFDFIEYCKKVYFQWNEAYSQNEEFRLFLITALFRPGENSKIKYFNGLRTIVIGKGTIDIWDDMN